MPDQIPITHIPKQGTPFNPSRPGSAAVQQTLIEVANQFIVQSLGRPSGGVADPSLFPHCLVVKISNASGANRNVGDVLKITSVLCNFPSDPLRVNKEPVYAGGLPGAITDVVAVLLEPIPHVTYETRLGKAVIMGSVMTRVNMTDAAHTFATPTASNATRLTSAVNGPIKILKVESGTGEKVALVLLQGIWKTKLKELVVDVTCEPTEGLVVTKEEVIVFDDGED